MRLTIDKLKAKLTHYFGGKHEVPQVCTQNMRWSIGTLQYQLKVKNHVSGDEPEIKQKVSYV